MFDAQFLRCRFSVVILIPCPLDNRSSWCSGERQTPKWRCDFRLQKLICCGKMSCFFRTPHGGNGAKKGSRVA